ncbi:MAG TPA: hypothetical protein VJL82_10240 [Rhizomicrobium sp.]|nr:hypothetical protein [Rhizomicrobium sp.]
MRIFGATVLATSLLITNAFAGTALTAGKPAGVKKAQMETSSMILIIGGVGLAGLGIGLAASGNGSGPTTTTTATVTTATVP